MKEISNFTVLVALIYMAAEIIYPLLIIINFVRKKRDYIKIMAIYCGINFLAFIVLSANNNYISTLLFILFILEVIYIKIIKKRNNVVEGNKHSTDDLNLANKYVKTEGIKTINGTLSDNYINKSALDFNSTNLSIDDNKKNNNITSENTETASSTIIYTREDIFCCSSKNHYNFYKALKNIQNIDIQTIGSDLYVELMKIDSMDGLTFEQYVANLLSFNGFVNISVTKSSNDYGVDIVAFKLGHKYAIQCKNYSSPLGNSSIQEVFTGMAHYNASKSAVITNSFFTKNAKKLAIANSVELWDREILIKFINTAINSKVCEYKNTPEDLEYSTLFNNAVEYSITKLSVSTTDLQRTFDLNFSDSVKLFEDLRMLGILENNGTIKTSKVIISVDDIPKRFEKYKF